MKDLERLSYNPRSKFIISTETDDSILLQEEYEDIDSTSIITDGFSG